MILCIALSGRKAYIIFLVCARSCSLESKKYTDSVLDESELEDGYIEENEDGEIVDEELGEEADSLFADLDDDEVLLDDTDLGEDNLLNDQDILDDEDK